MHSWRDLSDHFLDAHGLGAEDDLEARVGPTEGIAPPERLIAFRACAEADAEQLASLLRDARHRLFVKLLIFATETVPEAIFTDTVLAGVRTRNPSFNNHFLWPCVLVGGRRRVLLELLKMGRTGTTREKAGAARAVYWASIPLAELYWPHHASRPWHARPARHRGEPDPPIDDLRSVFAEWAASEFLITSDLDLRRALVVYLVQARKTAPELARAAIEAARRHEDTYIRERVRGDLGESEAFKAPA